jgi:carbon starvation protein
MLAAILLVTIALFWVAYRVYGGWMGRVYGLNDRHLVPSEGQYDGVDHVPTKTQVLLGHHFSSIAGAGPIVGPILAGLFFGWLPALIWIIAGSILVGGVHDFGSTIASVRHKARSVAELARQYITPTAFRLFLAFIWLALIYVIVVFMDLTAATFVNVEMNGSGVAISAIIFVGLALIMGSLTYRRGMSIKTGTLIFLPLLLLAIWIGDAVAEGAGLLPWVAGSEKNTWNLVLLSYCLVASITPVWILLQPRDYLSSWLLYLSVLGAGLGLLIGGLTGATAVATRWPALVSPSAVTGLGIAHIGPLFPILFITVACGACSGFHSIVASGTTSKQIKCETDSRRVGYGAMLIEGVVAVIALSAVVILPFSADAFGETPIAIYAGGRRVSRQTRGTEPIRRPLRLAGVIYVPPHYSRYLYEVGTLCGAGSVRLGQERCSEPRDRHALHAGAPGVPCIRDLRRPGHRPGTAGLARSLACIRRDEPAARCAGAACGHCVVEADRPHLDIRRSPDGLYAGDDDDGSGDAHLA